MFMKIKRNRFIIVALGSLLLAACNKTSTGDNNVVENGSASTMVSAFSLKSNNKVLPNLDSVFFSIDLVKAQIYNADSLPCGTDVRHLVVNISAPSSASGVEIIMPSLYDGRDTIIKYNNTPGDSINFSRGSVGLRVYAGNSDDQRYYTVKVNVHRMNPDSLQWTASASPLPGASAAVKQHSAVSLGSKCFSFAQYADGSCTMSCSTTPALATSWSTTAVSLPEGVDLATLRASSDVLYVLAQGSLYRSADGVQWQAVGQQGWTWLYGGYDSEIVGVNNGQWLTYPSGAAGEIPAGMPVEGTSPLWTYTNQWFITPQSIMIGGKDASGVMVGDAWGFDGLQWMRLSGQRALPASTGYALFPYFAYLTNPSTYYMTDKQSAWVALGGLKANGSVQPDVYISLDNGINWLKAPQDMQLPQDMLVGVHPSVMLSQVELGSRAIAPITSWDAPYIILTAGTTKTGVQLNKMWTGVINRLTFKPIQ